MKLFIFILVFFIFCSCRCSNHKISVDYYQFKLLNHSCQNLFKGYYSDMGINISNYYFSYSKTDMHLDGSVFVDTIVVLKPKGNFFSGFYQDSCYDDNADNILLIFKNIGSGKFKLWKRYDKVLNNKALPVYNDEIESYKNGFVIKGDFGLSSRKVFSKIFISHQSNEFYVDSIYIDEWGINQYDTTYYFDTFNLGSFNREFLDSIAGM